jgi:threonylcarbamoyladenosine tRNA methylthiotransferase MtaB
VEPQTKPQTPLKYRIQTLGCKANLYDSQQLEASLQSQGALPAGRDEEADLCIVNSCTVTDEAEKQSRKLATRLGRENPQAKVVFTGCSAEVNPEELLRVERVDYVLSNRDKPGAAADLKKLITEPAELPESGLLGAAEGYQEMRSRHPMDREWPLPETVMAAPFELLKPDGVATHKTSARTRAFLKIQEGCNAFCTYCVIPYGRGPSRSLRLKDVLEQVRRLVDEGTREIVLTGTNLGDYGLEWGDPLETFAEMVESILENTAIERVRLSSLDPVEITPRLRALVRGSDRLLPHFHVSLQHVNSRILKRMKRKYDREVLEECLHDLASLRPDIPGMVFVGMDYITGFPGESLEDHEEARDFLMRTPWTRLHVFPYSERAGTPATRLDQSVERGERKRRSRELNALSFERLQKHYRGILNDLRGQPVQDILIESPTAGPDGSGQWYSGYSKNYLRFLVRTAEGISSNQLVTLRPQDVFLDQRGSEVSFRGELV